ncbi:hypothetical protein K353_00890 [Kitasatospora sp. SolWspMP-SS2h]|uniref:DUF6585 family protein n=1 Tax=Kitasatospora sp. SolWspMP-SS2h TaxID=1305729 RepID=UPI000DB9E2C8|nr:DUF6585 family protein [Kitasatospora sp. SolWspMP-SS2h]RAJ45392.1 hypothetical protein K353_00890 [Kitasatospora sp. SolWspMP-SS2h]
MPATTPPAPLSPAHAELAARHGLGAPTATFEPQRYGVLLKVSFYLTLAVLLFLFVVPAVVFYYVSLRRRPDFNPRQAAKRLHLFEHGLIVDQETGPGAVALRWDEVRLHEEQTQKIINGIPGPIRYTCLLRTPGASVTVTDFYRTPAVWARAMQHAVLRAQGPGAQEALRSGGVLDFGPFDLSGAGITHQRQLLPWDRLGRVELGGGAVRVVRDDEPSPWARAMAKSVPNLSVFLALVEAHGAG